MKIKIRKNKHYPFFLFCLLFPIWFWKKKTKLVQDIIIDIKNSGVERKWKRISLLN